MSVAQGGGWLKGEKVYPRSIYNSNLICHMQSAIEAFLCKVKGHTRSEYITRDTCSVRHERRGKGEGVLEMNFKFVCFLWGGFFFSFHEEKFASITFLMKSFLKTLTLLFLAMYFRVVTIKCADSVMIMLLWHGQINELNKINLSSSYAGTQQLFRDRLKQGVQWMSDCLGCLSVTHCAIFFSF